jgi:hypothetical protein
LNTVHAKAISGTTTTDRMRRRCDAAVASVRRAQIVGYGTEDSASLWVAPIAADGSLVFYKTELYIHLYFVKWQWATTNMTKKEE